MKYVIGSTTDLNSKFKPLDSVGFIRTFNSYDECLEYLETCFCDENVQIYRMDCVNDDCAPTMIMVKTNVYGENLLLLTYFTFYKPIPA